MNRTDAVGWNDAATLLSPFLLPWVLRHHPRGMCVCVCVCVRARAFAWQSVDSRVAAVEGSDDA